ncbi:integrin beta-2 [Kryptolebias marmoratus]|uniref:Integrin beta n=1 Tax=Kryptolebias marmoratus TaxID=37003 RepID=A0A3Q2ZLP5_KRYMA|nr:integrin beta-2 [Kryptolebias marmoratus]
MAWGVLSLLLLLMWNHGLCQQEEVCSKFKINTCADCIKSGPSCSWCKQLNFTNQGEQEAVRCDTVAQLQKRGCNSEEIISPANTKTVVKEDRLSAPNTKDPVQMSPQEIRLNLRPGLPTTFPVSFKRAEGYPVDLYYLMDLSYSMKDDLQNVKSLGQKLFEALSKITKYGQIGFGAFVDKTVLPYTNTNKEKLQKPCDKNDQECQAAFGYRHVLNLTSRMDDFNERVMKEHISGNLDSPEGSLDAMMQAAVCGSKIGWRDSSTRLIVLATDAGFHMAGDGKLAGILEPNDEVCHLSGHLSGSHYTKSNEMDYPSVGQLAMQLEKNNIQPIFAVTNNVKTVYTELSKMIPKSEVGVLSENSDNVVGLIENAYNKLSSKVTLTHESLPDNVRVVYNPKCKNPVQEGENKGVCDSVTVNEEISFDVTVTADSCMEETSFNIKPLGIKDTLKVTITTNCECQCNDPKDINHSHCNYNGSINCGICSCLKGYVGQFCSCAIGDKDERTLRAPCQKNNGTECEGRGDCVCGRCECHKTEKELSYYGQYCQCVDDHCEKFNNKQCSGNGVCKCGKCKCNPDFEGSACQCQVSSEGCRTENNTVCYGRGSCTCNICDCKEGYQPPHCEKCLGCSDPCTTKHKQTCIECLGFNSGPFAKNCSAACNTISRQMVDKFTLPGNECKHKDSEGCWITFKLKQLVGLDNYTAEIQKERDCPKPPDVIAIIGGSVAAVAFIGILLLLLIKLLIHMKDLKEFRKFESEKKKSKWAEADNPLFQNATTTVANPTFTGE